MHFTFFERVNILSLDVFNEFVGLTCCPSTSGHFQKEDAFSFFAYCIFYSKMPFILILTHKSVCIAVHIIQDGFMTLLQSIAFYTRVNV